MIKHVINRIRVNFRSSRSDRAATGSYRNYHKQIKQIFQRIPIISKFKKISK